MKKLSLLLAVAIGATYVQAETVTGIFFASSSDMRANMVQFNPCTVKGNKCISPEYNAPDSFMMTIDGKLFDSKKMKSCVGDWSNAYQLDVVIYKSDKNSYARAVKSIKSCKRLDGVTLDDGASS